MVKHHMPPHEKQKSPCPVQCAVCSHNRSEYPARFEQFAIPADQAVRKISHKSNHIVFLLEGALHVILENRDIYIQTGQAIFFGRNTRPYVRATRDSEVVWLEFSNRIVLGGGDMLSKVAAAAVPREDDIPVLDLTQRILAQLRDMPLIDSPCYHMCRQYELYLLMKCEYSDQQVARFFRVILRARDDFRAFVINNYRYGDTLEEVARKANMSTNYFLRKFKEHFAMTAHQWLVKQKVKKLVQTIHAGETDAKRLAERFGFHSTTGLYLFCRRQVGKTFSQLTAQKSENPNVKS